MLDGSGIVTVVGELEAAGMSEHVGMNGEADARRFADPRERLAEAYRTHRPASLSDKQIRRAPSSYFD